jgi:phosphatidylglycerophosphate synthase
VLSAASLRRDLPLLPNLVSLGRIVLVILAVVLFVRGWRWSGLLIGIAAGLSDHLDGWLARRRGEVTELGALLDVLADMLFQLLGFSLAVYAGAWPLALLLAWGVRDLAVTGLRVSAARQGVLIPSTPLAKVAVNFNYYAFVVMAVDVIRPFARPSLAAGVHWLGLSGAVTGVALQWISAVGYLRSYRRHTIAR